MSCMEYNTFLSYIRENISDYLEDIEVKETTIIHTNQNNGVMKDELLIRTAGSDYATAIGLEPFYQRHMAGIDADTILDDISDTYFANMVFPGRLSANDLHIFERVKDYIYLRVINKEKNEKLLEQEPYMTKLDLAFVFRVHINSDFHMNISAQVTWDMLKAWHIDVQQLYGLALKNTARLFPARIASVTEVLQHQNYPGIEEAACPLYVISNAQHVHGAAAVFYPDVLKQQARLWQSNIYLMPSSVHEMMMLAGNYDIMPQKLASIVREVNECAVAAVEKLSDHVYYYDAQKDEIRMIL